MNIMDGSNNMDIQSACGCTIQLTTEDLDKQVETKGEWLKTKLVEHMIREHRDSTKPLSEKELKQLEEIMRM